MFSLSLTGTAFSWFTTLTPNSIQCIHGLSLSKSFMSTFIVVIMSWDYSNLTLVKQWHAESIAEFIRRFREAKNWCYSLNFSEKDLAKFAFNVLRSHLKEKLDGHDFAIVNQVCKRSLAQESRGKYRHKSNRRNMHRLNCDSLDDEDKDVYVDEDKDLLAQKSGVA